MLALGANLHIENNSNLTSLHFAAQGDQPRVLHYLIRNGSGRFLIDQTDLNGYTPLHWACLSGSYQSVRYLLANGANVNRVTTSEKTTTILLCLKNMEETREPRIIHKLLIYGADPDFKVKIFIELFYRTKTGKRAGNTWNRWRTRI